MGTFSRCYIGTFSVRQFGGPQDVGRGSPQQVEMGRHLALYRGLYGDVVLRTSLERNLAEWVVLSIMTKILNSKLVIT